MSNERADDFLSWRGRLTPPDALPEQGLEDKELSWQRLAERLQKQPRRNNIAWWIAAACLILAFFLPATHLFRGRPNRPSRVTAHLPTRIVTQPGHDATERDRSAVQADRSAVRADRSAVQRDRSAVQPDRSAPPFPLTPQPATVSRPIISRPASPHMFHSNYGDFATIKNPVATSIPATRTPPPADSVNPMPLLLAQMPQPGSPATSRPHPGLRIVYFNELNNNNNLNPSLATRPPTLFRLGAALPVASNWTADPAASPLIKIELSSPSH